MAKKKQDVGNLLLRNAAEFYTVPLDNDYCILTDEALKKCVDLRTLKAHGWFYPTLKFVSFKDGKLELLNTSNKVSYKLYIVVEKDKLNIACSCATQVEKLCQHTYRALDKLLSYNGSTDYFEKFSPNGLAEVALANKRCFEFEYVGNGLVIKPKEELGSVYNLKEKISAEELDAMMALPAKQSPPNEQPKDISVCYILMVSRRNNFLPFLIPCIGRLNKAGTAIKGFNKFLSGVEKVYDALLTDEQRALNRVCLDMWKHVEKFGDIKIFESMSDDDRYRLSILFELWQKAIHLLQKQYVFKHPFFHTRYLKRSPSKSYIEDIHICQEIPSIQFQLIDKGAFYQLEMKVLLSGKALKNFEPITTFFIQQEKKIYMLSSQRDVAMSEWMRKSGERITIFKQHFTEFENGFLKLLCKYYSVEIVKPHKVYKRNSSSKG